MGLGGKVITKGQRIHSAILFGLMYVLVAVMFL